MKKEKLTTKKIGDTLVVRLMELLAKTEGGFMSSGDIVKKLKTVALNSFPKSSYPELYDSYESDNTPKWLKFMQFQRIFFDKAGLLSKGEGKRVWHLEGKGRKLLESGKTVDEIAEIATKGYWEWQEKYGKPRKSDSAKQPVSDKKSGRAKKQKESILVFVAEAEEAEGENIEIKTLEDMQAHIEKINPYEYQNLVAALLRGMGYYVSEVAGKGADGGVDILAYRDPLGEQPPRIKVQVKKQESTVGSKEVDELQGNLKDGDIGIFVSNSGFSKPARDSARKGNRHIRLIDSKEFLQLWQKHYSGMDELDRAKMPLKQVYVFDAKRIMDE